VRKLHALIYEYGDDVLERRGPFRDEHLALIAQWNTDGKLVIAGALGDPPHGGFIAFDVADPAEVEAFVAADPYAKEGIVTSHRVEPWTVVTP
jgi:uncharacterized protein YciI